MTKQHKTSPISTLGLAIWGLAAIFYLYEFFLRTFVGSVAHQIIPDLHLNAETFAIIGSAYYVAYGVMQIPVGILADKFGVKIIMFFATLACVISTYMFAHATGFTSAVISRLIMGFGSSFAFVCLLVIAATWFPKKNFGFFAGTSQFIGTMGPLLAAGPLVALMAKTHQDWRSTLIEIGSFGLLLAVLVLLLVKNKPRKGTQSLIILVPGEPIISRLFKLFRNKQAWVIALYSATIYPSIALLGAIWGTEYLQVQGLSQSVAANIISVAWLGFAIGCPLLGAISDIAKRRKPALIFCALIGFFSTIAITYLPLHHSQWAYALVFFMFGLSASGQNIGFATIAEQTNLTTRATAIGLNNGALILSSALIPPLASYFIHASLGPNESILKPENFTVAFTIMPVLYSIATILAIFYIKETYCKPQKEAIKLIRD